MKTLIFFFLIWLSSGVFSQNAYEDIRYNRAVLRYYTGPELVQLETESPIEYEKLKYYFVNSFSVVRTDCESCEVDFTEFFNIDLFNVRDFENIRLEDDVIEINYRDKYKVTLYSKKSVRVKYDEIESTLAEMRIASASLPEYVNTGDPTQDYNTYRSQLEHFASNNIDDFEIHTSKQGFLVITFTEFMSLPAARQNSVLNHPSGYMIID